MSVNWHFWVMVWVCLLAYNSFEVCQFIISFNSQKKICTFIFLNCHQLIANNVYSFPHWIESEISKEDSETNTSPVQLHINQNMTNLCRKNIFCLDFIAQLLYIIEGYKYFYKYDIFSCKINTFFSLLWTNYVQLHHCAQKKATQA